MPSASYMTLGAEEATAAADSFFLNRDPNIYQSRPLNQKPLLGAKSKPRFVSIVAKPKRRFGCSRNTQKLPPLGRWSIQSIPCSLHRAMTAWASSPESSFDFL